MPMYANYARVFKRRLCVVVVGLSPGVLVWLHYQRGVEGPAVCRAKVPFAHHHRLVYAFGELETFEVVAVEVVADYIAVFCSSFYRKRVVPGKSAPHIQLVGRELLYLVVDYLKIFLGYSLSEIPQILLVGSFGDFGFGEEIVPA